MTYLNINLIVEFNIVQNHCLISFSRFISCCKSLCYWHSKEPSWPWSYGSWIYNDLWNRCLSPLMLWVWILLRVRCTTLCDKVCQWLQAVWWLSPGTPVSSTNKSGRYDITERVLKVTLNTINLIHCVTGLALLLSYLSYDGIPVIRVNLTFCNND
jgi:hypothetical protein